MSAQSNGSSAGAGSVRRSEQLVTNVAAVVTQVLPNGNLVVRGEKLIGINQGHEFVRLAGVVRTQDIQPDNSVLSTQVADAKISYGGKGALADSNSNGWLGRFFLSPWWPF